ISMRSVLFAILLVAALGCFGYSSRRLVRFLSIGRKDNRLNKIAARLKNVLIVAFGQTRLLRDPLAVWMHFFIFWGFVILLSGILEAIVEGFRPGLTLELLGPLFPPLAAVQETIGALVVVSVLIALFRWMLVPPRRFYGPEVTGHVRLDAAV